MKTVLKFQNVIGYHHTRDLLKNSNSQSSDFVNHSNVFQTELDAIWSYYCLKKALSNM